MKCVWCEFWHTMRCICTLVQWDLHPCNPSYCGTPIYTHTHVILQIKSVKTAQWKQLKFNLMHQSLWNSETAQRINMRRKKSQIYQVCPMNRNISHILIVHLYEYATQDTSFTTTGNTHNGRANGKDISSLYVYVGNYTLCIVYFILFLNFRCAMHNVF